MQPLIPSPAIGGGVGLPQAKSVIPATHQQSDANIPGAIKINPALAPAFFDGRYRAQSPRPNYLNKPLLVTDKAVSQAQATQEGKNAWKKRTADALSNTVLWGNGKPQKPVKVPWTKVFIPPLALFNDASQWVNRLMFNQPMQKSGSGNSMPNLKAQYFTPPPNITNNFASGTLNAQLQLGQLAIQTQQLTISASNYFGGS